MRRQRWPIWLGMLLCLALASCGTPTAKIVPTPKPPTPTATPQPKVTLQALSVGMAGVRTALPGAAGIVLSDLNLFEGAFPPNLSFYRYSTHAVEQIAIPSSPTNVIVDAAYGGDWVAYVAATGKSREWQLWAYNVSTGERIQVDSAARENTSADWRGLNLRVNATDVVWSVQYPIASEGAAQWDTKVFDFSFATRTTAILYSVHMDGVYVMAMTDSALLVKVIDSTTYLPSLYLLPHGGSAKLILKGVAQSDVSIRAAMNDQYVVWDDGAQDALTLYNLQTDQMTTYWAPCDRPAMSSTAPYVICNQQPKHTYALIHLPDGALTTYGEDQDGSLTSPGPDQIYKGRVFHVSTTGEVQYFDLPTL